MSQPDPRSSIAPNCATVSSRKRPRHPATCPDPSVPENRRRDPKVSRACDACKNKKIRCSGTLPCNNCSRRRLSCTYASKYARGRPPTPPSLEVSPHDEVIQRNYRDELPFPYTGTSHAESGLDQSLELSSISSAAHGDFVDGRDVAVSRASPDLVIEGQYYDPTSGLSFLHRAWNKLLTRERQMGPYESTEGERSQLLASAGDRPFIHVRGHDYIAASDDTTIRELVRVYFDTCVVTYRMLHRQTVEAWLETMLEDRRNNCPMSQSLGNACCAIVFTIIAIARFRIFKLEGKPSDTRQDSSQQVSDGYFCAAMELIDLEVGFPRLESAQARLIQVLYLLQTSRMNKAWYTFGNACQIISSLGLHRRRSRKPLSYTASELPYITQQCGKRVFWVAYTIDKYLSVVFGRPRLLYDEDINQEFPDSVNDEDLANQGRSDWEASEECHVDSLVLHAKVARIIGRLSREVYVSDSQSNADRVAAAQRLVEELHAWRGSLPPHLGSVKPSTLIPSFRREATALSLAYWHALIHANRPFLLGDGSIASDNTIIQERVTECMFAARKALELVNSMANDVNLFHSFWWMNYVTFCALAVVYAWQINQNTGFNHGTNSEMHGKLLELAEKCHAHLLSASSAASHSRRYSIILDELRLEAQRGAARSQNVGPVATDALDAATSQIGEQSLPARCTVPEGLGNHVAVPDNMEDLPNIFDAWQTTDWLDLDSSAFYPMIDGFTA